MKELDKISKISRVFSSQKAIELLFKMNELRKPMNTFQLIKEITKDDNPKVGSAWYNAMDILIESDMVKEVYNPLKFKKYILTQKGIKLIEFLMELIKEW